MIPKRIIPFFLLKGNRLIKGTRFKKHIDVGDPLSQALIYDAQGAEELIVVDIAATAEKRIIKLEIINKMITRCRLPIAVGGGISSVVEASRCFSAGADKIIVNTAAVIRPQLVKELVDAFGSANVMVAIDVKKIQDAYRIYIYNGTRRTQFDLINYVKQVVFYGAGEIVITSIDQEGTLNGFECELYTKLRPQISVPMIASGGAGTYDDIVHIFEKSECDGVALGKMLFLRDYDIVRIKSYLKGKRIFVRDA